MKSKISALGLISLFLIMSACVTTKAVRLGTGPVRPPVPENQVAVYRTADQVPGNYEEIALLSSTGEAMWTNEEQMWKSMKKKAGKMGANAIILDAMSEPSAGAKVASNFLGVTGAQRKGKAIAVYVFHAREIKEIKKVSNMPLEKQQPIEQPEVVSDEEKKGKEEEEKDKPLEKKRLIKEKEAEPKVDKEVMPEKKERISKEEKKDKEEKVKVPEEKEKEFIVKGEEGFSGFSSKIEVVIDKSEIRLMPDHKSQVIGRVRFGALLESIEKIGEWYKVYLPTKEEGVEILGYIHNFCVRGKAVKIYLKDGTVLRANILSEDTKKIIIVTKMGKFRISHKEILKIERE